MRFAKQLNMIDEPGGRKVHEVAIPRCGGIGLAAGVIVAILMFVPFRHEVIGLLTGGAIIIIFGLLDDRFELNYKWKFVGQFFAVIAVIYAGLSIANLPFNGLNIGPVYLSIPLTVFFAIGVINAVNLSDGLDGLAAGTMLLTFATMAYLAIDSEGYTVALMAIAVAGGIVGFLWFNTHPAMVFMGDTGSQFIGYMAVFLSVYLTQHVNQALNPALPLLLLGLPILDTLTVMVGRIRSGRSPFSPDKTHIHHRFMERGFSHASAVGTIYLIQGIFLASALLFRYSADYVVIGVYLLISSVILGFFYWTSKTGWMLSEVNPDAERRGKGLWRSTSLFVFCRHYINYSLAIFLLSQMACLYGQVLDLSIESWFVLLGGGVLYFILPKLWQDVWVRFSMYISAIFANIMTEDFPEMIMHTHWVVDVFLVALIVVVTVAIRTTRKSKFRLTTQDVLVVLLVIASIVLFDVKFIEHLSFRLFCLVYALEYLLHRDIYKFRLTRYTSAVSGLLIILLVVPTLS